MNTYRDLIVWQKAMTLVTDVYMVTSAFPKEEMFSITSQIKRSSISIPSNLAEGFGRHYTREFIRFMQISRGSLYELQTQLEIAGNLNFLDQKTLQNLLCKCNEIERMLNKLISKIEQSPKKI